MLTRFSEKEDARLRAEVKIVLEKKIEIDEIVPQNVLNSYMKPV